MDMENVIDTPLPAKCEQLAEECCELAKAALKISRIVNCVNPTPIKMDDALAQLTEEIADVRVCIYALEQNFGAFDTAEIEKRKIERWISRLDGRNEHVS